MASFSIPGLGFAKPNEDLPALNDEVPSTTVDTAATSTAPNDTPVPQPSSADPIVANTADGAIQQDADVSMSEPLEQPPQSAEEPIRNQGQPESMDIEKPPTEIPIDSSPQSNDMAPPAAQVQVNSQVDAVPETSQSIKANEAPANGASITDDLEAAIGGLGPFTTAAAVTAETQATTSDQPEQQPGEYPEWEADSSPYVSSSESSESDSSSEDDSEDEQFAAMSLEEAARMLMEAEGSDDEDKGDKTGRGQIRTKNELAEAPLPKPDVVITPEARIEELGAVEHIVDTTIVIKAVTPGEYQVIDSGSVLCTGERVVIGALADVLGKVQAPLYTVRFETTEEIKELGLEVGTKIYYLAEHANYVFTQAIKNLKGSDASNLHDEEVGEDEAEFSDDEKEAEHKRRLKQKRRERHGHGETRGRGGRGPHPLRNEMRSEGPSGAALNYDDDGEDGPYKPLARPPGYGSGGFSEATEEPPPGTHRHRGGRGGFNRGRGGPQRGRGQGRGRGGYTQGGGNMEGYSKPPQGGQYSQQQQQQQPPPSLPSFGQQAGFNFQMPQIPPPPPGQTQPGAAPSFPAWNGMPTNLPFNAQVPPPPPGTWPGQQMPAGAPAAGNPAFSPQILGLLAQMMGQNRAQNQNQNQNQWPGQQPGPQGGYGSGR